MNEILDTDQELDQLRCRGTDALPGLLRQYRPRLLRMILLRLDCRVMVKVDGDDILQEVFLEAAGRLPRYLDQAAVPPFVWLRQIAHQVLIATHRRYLGAKMRDLKHEVSLERGGDADASSALLAQRLADSLTSPSQRVVRTERVAAVRAAMEMLDAADREVLVLRHLEELSNHEVAHVLGIEKFAASKRYLRALARLVKCLPREG